MLKNAKLWKLLTPIGNLRKFYSFCLDEQQIIKVPKKIFFSISFIFFPFHLTEISTLSKIKYKIRVTKIQ